MGTYVGLRSKESTKIFSWKKFSPLTLKTSFYLKRRQSQEKARKPEDSMVTADDHKIRVMVMVVMVRVMTTWWRVGDGDGGQTQAELPQTPLLRSRSSSRGAAEIFDLEREK